MPRLGTVWLAVLVIAFAFAAFPCQAQNSTLRFSEQPTEQEIFKARVFDEPLLPIGGEPRPEENKALADAMSAYAGRTTFDDPSSFNDFLGRFPASPWTGSLLLHLGVEYYHYGYYSKALDAWEQAWQILQNSTDSKGKLQADRSLGELARMYSKLGRMDELRSLLTSVAGRPLRGPATTMIGCATQALWMMDHRPGSCFKCGPFALNSILAETDRMKAANPLIIYAQSTTNGYSLPQLARLSLDVGMHYQMAFRSPSAPWIVPAVIHWKVGHYAALLRKDGNSFLVKDRTFINTLEMSPEALEEEGSGYFLVPPGPLPNGWRAVSEIEGQHVWGRGYVYGQDITQVGTGPNVVQVGGSVSAGAMCPANPANPYGPGTPGDASGTGDPNAVNSCGTCAGMTTYTMDAMLASLSLNDTPVGYKPPVGPWVEFTATYDQNETTPVPTFNYSNLGQKWTCNWFAFINDTPGKPASGATYYEPGGGILTFSDYDPTNQTFAVDPMTQALLLLTSSNSYELQFRTGAKEEFTLSDGGAGSSRLIFLTQISDPAGNFVRLNYDSDFRLTNIVDAIGQTTILTYTNKNYPYAVTSVSDPFGRSAAFQYNASGLLVQITDVLGLSSQYIYGANEFVTNLVTPYGTTVFTNGTISGAPWLQATDPLGESELAETTLNGIGTVSSDPASTVPTNMPVAPYNQYLDARDTFFWDKNADQLGAWNPADAKVYHFCHVGVTDTESGALESVKAPLENRVWYNYYGQIQGNVFEAPSINRPTAVGRVLDNGSTQLRLYQYNSLCRVTNSTDPLGRNLTFVYATNNVDLLQVIMTSNGRAEVQSSMTYNSQHRPLTITDAAGQTTTNIYNTRGQILSTTDPLGETNTFSYDTNGYLLSITGPLQNASDNTSFTYDGYGRIQTVTDTADYTLTYAYDAMDRTTNITYPDGTTQQFVYSNLDLVASADRLGRWTTNTYNADRQLIQTRDPLGRVSQFNYCDCGDLEAMLDPAGNATWWDHDVQSRVTGKYYADGSGITYTYENTTSRRHSRLDEKGQQTIYQYYDDNNLQSVSYPNAIIATPSVSFTYDTNYNRIASMQDGIGTTIYAYNPITVNPALGAGQLASVTGPLPNSTVTYNYDPLERVVRRAVNGVAQATFFDVLGRPNFVTNVLGAFQYAYVDATPRLAAEVYPNGQTNLYAYYNNVGDQRLLQIEHLYPNGSLLSQFGYGYNSVGQITAWTNQWDTLPAREWFPSYDAADELTNVLDVGDFTGVTNYTYGYDQVGNRVVAGTNALPNQYYYNTLNQIVGSSATLANVSYEWDAENRLTAIGAGSNRSEFRYDGLGRRVGIVEKTNGIVATSNYYLWCGSGICEVLDSTGTNVLRQLVPQGESLIGATITTNYFYNRDHLGSIREVVDGRGNLITRYDYDPFGQRSILLTGFEATIGFTGAFIHQKSGIDLTWYRALDSRSGRWLSRDPSGLFRGMNLYAYAADNPIRFSDPLGLCPGNTSSWQEQLLQVFEGADFGANIEGALVETALEDGFLVGALDFSIGLVPGLFYGPIEHLSSDLGSTEDALQLIGYEDSGASWHVHQAEIQSLERSQINTENQSVQDSILTIWELNPNMKSITVVKDASGRESLKYQF